MKPGLSVVDGYKRFQSDIIPFLGEPKGCNSFHRLANGFE